MSVSGRRVLLSFVLLACLLFALLSTQTFAEKPRIEYELRVADVEASARFYRDGLGMQEGALEGSNEGRLLELFGVGLRILPAEGSVELAPPSGGNPLVELLSRTGFRYLSIWSQSPQALVQRLVSAGYAAPRKLSQYWFTQDPDGNWIELGKPPKNLAEERVSCGVVVSELEASLAFYRDLLNFAQLAVWPLPAPVSGDMVVLQAGPTLLKMVASPSGPDTLTSAHNIGLCSLTLYVDNFELATQKTGALATLAPDGKSLSLHDPDGNRVVLAAQAEASASSNGLRFKELPDCDAVRDASGTGQLFESIEVPGLTDSRVGVNGFALADLNQDGLADFIGLTSAPRFGAGLGQRSNLLSTPDQLKLLLNTGDLQFAPAELNIEGVSPGENFLESTQIPNLADFNQDGFLDLFITRHSPSIGGNLRPGKVARGNILLLSKGSWDTFVDVSDQMGVRNELAYNRQTSIGDVNGDGWLDVAIGCDNIGNAQGGFPYSRLYVYHPAGESFIDGHFEDVGGTDLVPDFGGFYHDSARDRGAPDIDLRDLDNDGDLDLIQASHVDVRQPLLPYSPGEYRQGLFCWRNLEREKGTLQFEKLSGNGLTCEARLRYNRDTERYEPADEARAPGLPYLSYADIDNDGLLDVLAVGPSDSTWSPRTEYVGGRFWHNLGDLQFEERTSEAGLDSLNNTYRDWYAFFELQLTPYQLNYVPRNQSTLSQPGLIPPNPIDNRPYYADSVFADFDNDGWTDLVVLDRRETPGIESRAVLYMNRGDGTFEPKPTTFSGLDGSGISAEACDLDGDGLLDLFFAADPDNSGLANSPARYESKVYWNTGLFGAKENHWLRLRCSGLSDAALMGTRVEAHNPTTGELLAVRWVHSNHSYKSGGALEVHFGLGNETTVDLNLFSPGLPPVEVTNVSADRYLDLNMETGELQEVKLSSALQSAQVEE